MRATRAVRLTTGLEMDLLNILRLHVVFSFFFEVTCFGVNSRERAYSGATFPDSSKSTTHFLSGSLPLGSHSGRIVRQDLGLLHFPVLREGRAVPYSTPVHSQAVHNIRQEYCMIGNPTDRYFRSSAETI